MGTKHKKKDKESSYRSPSKHKSKKKKNNRSPSRSRERERDRSRKKTHTNRKDESPDQKDKGLSDKQLQEMFGGLQGFNLDFFKKLQDQVAKGHRPPENKEEQTIMGLSGFLPYVSQQIPIQLPQVGSIYKRSARTAKNLKTSFKQRLLIPLVYDSIMPILEDEFYREYITEDLLKYMQRRLIYVVKKRVTEQKQDDFMDKVDKLEKAMNVQQSEEDEPAAMMNLVESVLSAWEGKDNARIDPSAKELFKKQESTQVVISDKDLFEEARLLLE